MKHIIICAMLASATLLGLWLNDLTAKPEPYIAILPSPPHVGSTLSFSGCNYSGRPKDIAVKIYGPNGSEVFGFATHTDNGVLLLQLRLQPQCSWNLRGIRLSRQERR